MKVNMTYEPYAEEPEYIETNRALLEGVRLEGAHKALDVACGTGLFAGLLLEVKPELSVYGIDLSEESLEIGRRVFRNKGLLDEEGAAAGEAARGKPGKVVLQAGSADELPFGSDTFDLAVMGNAIHLMPDLDRFLQGLRRVLASGGQFTFNTVFFVGTFPAGTEQVYMVWMKEALAVLHEKNEERRARGEKLIPRARGKGGRAFDKGWKSPEQWQEVLERNEFELVCSHKRLTHISREGLALVGAYGGLAEVLMSGYPVAVASECLQSAAGRAFDKLGITEVPRYWLEITAVKR